MRTHDKSFLMDTKLVSLKILLSAVSFPALLANVRLWMVCPLVSYEMAKMFETLAAVVTHMRHSFSVSFDPVVGLGNRAKSPLGCLLFKAGRNSLTTNAVGTKQSPQRRSGSLWRNISTMHTLPMQIQPFPFTKPHSASSASHPGVDCFVLV
jgi:hypothetical protein